MGKEERGGRVGGEEVEEACRVASRAKGVGSDKGGGKG